MAVDVTTLSLAVESSGVATASDRLKALAQDGGNAEASVNKLSKASSDLTGYLKMAAEAFAAWKLSQYIKDATLLAARVETLGVVMRVVGNNAGYTANQMDLYAKGIAKMGITTEASRSAAVKMAQAQIDMSKSSDLARVAQDAAVIANINSSEAFDRMTTGLATGQAVILHHMGLMVNFGKAEHDLASELGKTAEELTNQEKTQARVNEVMRVSIGINGAYEASMTTAGKQLNSLKRYFDEIKLSIGEPFTPAFSGLLADVTTGLKALSSALHNNKEAMAVLAQEMVNPMGLFTDMKALLEMNTRASEALTSSLPAMEGALLTIAAAAVSAVGGLTGMAAAFDGLIAAIAASQAANPAAWAVAVGAATYVAAKSAVTSLDSLGHAYIGINLTGEAYYKEEQARLKKSEKNWDDFKKKAVWMYKEGGIKTPVAMEDPEVKRMEASAKLRAEEAAAAEKAAAEKAAEEARELAERQARYNQQLEEARNSLTQARIAKDKQIEDAALKDRLERLNQEKDAGLKTTAAYLNEKYALERASMQKELDAANALADARFETVRKVSTDPGADLIMQTKAIEEYTKALQAALKIKEKMDISTTKKVGDNAQLQRDNEHYQAEMNIQRLQAQGLNIAAEAAANELKYSDLKKKGYTEEQIGIQRTNDLIKISVELYQQQMDNLRELNTLKAENAAGAASLVGTNKAGGFDSIEDHTANALAQQKAAHEERMRLIQEEQDANLASLMAQQKSYEEYIAKRLELDKKAGIEHEKNSKATEAITEQSTNSQLSLYSQYTGLAGGLFGDLANAMDQSSRGGFEAAKAFNMAQTVMSTAAAVMNALATVQPYPLAVAAAAGAAAQGAIQLGIIASTQFGGGGKVAPSISAGSFGGGGGGASSTVGSSIGGPIKYGADATSTEGMAALSTAAKSASLAVGDLATAFTKAADAFSEGGTGESLVDRIIGLVSKQISTNAVNILADPQLQAGVSAVYQQGIDTIAKAAAALGTSVGTVHHTSVGWTGEEFNKEGVAKTLNDELNALMNDTAKAVKGLEEYAKPGEDASKALERLSGALYDTNKQFDMLGITLLNGLSGANIASKLEDAFASKGEDFHKAVDNYFTGLFTDEEQKAMKAAQAQRTVDAAFAQMGIAAPQTNAQFIALVNSLDLTTEQGQSTFATLMSISESFGTMTKQAEDFRKAQQDLNDSLSVRYLKATGQGDAATILDLQIQQANELRDAQAKGLDTTQLAIVQALELAQAQQQIADTAAAAQKALADKELGLKIQIMQLSGDTEGATALQREKELAAMDASLRPLQERIYALQDESAAMTAAKNAVSSAMTVLQKSVQTAKDAAQSAYNDQIAQINAAKDAQAAAYQSQEKAAQDYVSKLSATAGSIKSALDSVLGSGGDTLLSRQAAEKMIHGYAVSGRLPLNGELDGALKAITQPSEGFFSSLTDYKRDAAKTANDLSILNNRAQGQLSNAQLQLQALQDANKQAQEAFTAQEKAAKDQLDAQNRALDLTLTKAQQQIDAVNGTTVAVMSVADAVANLSAALVAQSTLTDHPSPTIANLQAPSQVGSGYSFAVGSPFIPFDMTAQIHQGEMVIDRASSDILRKYGIPAQGAADNRELVNELKTLRAELKAANLETIKANKKMAKYMEIWDGNGMPETRAAS